MASYPGGAGNLGSYMSGGGGYETSSQSSASGNGQAILLLLVAGVVCTVLLSVKFNQSTASNTRGAGYTDNGSNYYKNGTNNGGSGNNSNSFEKGQQVQTRDDEEEEEDVLSEFNSLEDLDLDKLVEKLGETKTWVKADDELILKVLENKTFENVIEDDFDAEVTKVNNFDKGRAEYLINIKMKEEVQNGGLYISGITTYDINEVESNHEVPNTNSKTFSIIASDKLKEVKIKTYTGNVVVVSGDINIGNITKEDKYISFDVTSKNGINKAELIDSNNTVKASYKISSDGKQKLKNKDGVIKIRLTDKNGFVAEKSIQ